jgi:hypothetical protein
VRNSPGPALDISTRLRVKGFNVAIENFGSGHAAVEKLRRIPFTQARLAPLLVCGDRAGPTASGRAGGDRRRGDITVGGRIWDESMRTESGPKRRSSVREGPPAVRADAGARSPGLDDPTVELDVLYDP